MRVSFRTSSWKTDALSVMVIAGIVSCSDAVDQLNVEIEPTMGVLGGAVLATQNTGLLAFVPRKKNPPLFHLKNLVNPFPEAFASCPAITYGSCLDDGGQNTPGNNRNLQLFYNNCQSSGMSEPGYWRAYIVLTFESEASCTAVRGAGGFTGSGLTAVNNQTVIKTYGSLEDDQYNIRLSPYSTSDRFAEAAFLYSKYGSGWDIEKKGGVEIRFSGSTRTIRIKGVHVFSVKYDSLPIQPSNSYNLVSLTSDVSVAWDHTINTVVTGDTLYTLGPGVTESGGTYSFGAETTSPTASFDGDAVVTSNTVLKGAVFRIQQNLVHSIAVAVVTKDLVYDDATCCWPSSGVVESRFGQGLPAPTPSDRIEFLGKSCGSVRYETADGESARGTLLHCF